MSKKILICKGLSIQWADGSTILRTHPSLREVRIHLKRTFIFDEDKTKIGGEVIMFSFT